MVTITQSLYHCQWSRFTVIYPHTITVLFGYLAVLHLESGIVLLSTIMARIQSSAEFYFA